MKTISKIPKTFVIFFKQNQKEGYLRFKSYRKMSDDIFFTINIEKNIKNASIFVNFDNVKKIANSFINKYNFDEIKIIDTKTSKIFYVKKENKKIKTKSQI